MRSLAMVAAMLLLLVAAAGCGANQQGSPETAQAEVRVLVENQAFADVTIYVYERGRRVRLGDVPGVSSRTFTIPDRLIFGISSLQFQIDPIGQARAPLTRDIAVTEGDRLRLIIPPF